jgi:hypothetical protein
MGVHLMGVHLMGVHLTAYISRACISQGVHLIGVYSTYISYPLHAQHLVQARRSLDGKAPYPGA